MLARIILIAMATALQLTSPAFNNGERLPVAFTAAGANTPPPLHWSGVPAGTKSLVLICQDPDAPGEHAFTHWVVVNMPQNATNPSQGTAGFNDFGSRGWRGPDPPPGKLHHYIFTLYALNTVLSLPHPTGPAVLAALRGHIVARASLTGTWER
ncbi:MAG: YbhB/YbcL family Raf kinase inhibitor-like protein [Candidatus Xenobia bacterium]